MKRAFYFERLEGWFYLITVAPCIARKTGEGEYLFFDTLKLLWQAISNFFIETISKSVLILGSALLALLQ